MSIRTLAITAFIGGISIATAQTFISYHVAEIEEATAQQCITHDWPATAHAIHVEWCEHNGYPTN